MTEGREGTKFGYATKGDLAIYSTLDVAVRVTHRIREDVGYTVGYQRAQRRA